MENFENIIAGHKFLEGLDKNFLKKIVRCATAVEFGAGKHIFRQGDTAENFYLLIKGRVAVGLDSPEKGTLLVETLSAGEVLGWSWLVPPHKWRFNATATSATYAIVINGEKLRLLCEDDHELGFEITKRFLNVIATRLEMANLQLLDLYTLRKDVKEMILK
ncbi:MAG: hypothetical protein AUJ72_02875 [Candidatus Omnitrophica bacterium CG1_02_46_14]|nr:MAG: hypothetical protein AUJ72_02875 [Candidatus Omnitrophica bacterium CG1_02_46_14]